MIIEYEHITMRSLTPNIGSWMQQGRNGWHHGSTGYDEHPKTVQQLIRPRSVRNPLCQEIHPAKEH